MTITSPVKHRTEVTPATVPSLVGVPPAVARPGPVRPSLSDLSAAARSDRNRAIDFYRAAAMAAVAFGHWLAMVTVSDNGRLVGGNALGFAPTMAWLTWPLQVMPLFFVVGGFSSAMSLDAHQRNDGRPQDWIAARLRRMLPPAVALAATWLTVIATAAATGHLELALVGAHAAAIPLWFLANYTIDTALAPLVLPRFRARPRLVAGAIVGAFAFFEGLRIAAVPFVPPVNWVLGWLAFQLLGMAWRDGRLPTGRRLLATAGVLWAAALALVLTGGPWAVSMVNIPGMENSPTSPPTMSLLVFGAAYSLTAIALAPTVSRALAARPWAWVAVVAANSVAMTVYLWHMTAAVVVAAVAHLTIGLPEVSVGSASWWWWKLPTILASLAVLAVITAVASPIERRALLAPRRPWNGGVPSIMALAVVTSMALKWWTNGEPAVTVPCLALLVVLGHTVFRPSPNSRAARGPGSATLGRST